jgi:ABC-2 type transport system ATP-binding protein
MISASGVTKAFGKTEALRGVNLTVATGELFALIGPDGAGKTTFFRLVAGLLKPTAGTLTLAPIRTFGFVPQRFGLYEDLSIDENLALRAQLYGLSAAEGRRRSAALLGRVGLDRFGARLAGALSGGMKQKLALVAALITEPELLLLDEPTTGVDPVSRREFWNVLNQLHHGGMTILVSTPYMDEAEYATRVGFLDEGRLLAVGTTDEVLATYPRALAEVQTADRMNAQACLRRVAAVDDVSLFGTRLHVRAADGVSAEALLNQIRQALEGVVAAGGVSALKPSLEDVFVLLGERLAAEEQRR